jgi:hypothetical protein
VNQSSKSILRFGQSGRECPTARARPIVGGALRGLRRFESLRTHRSGSTFPTPSHGTLDGVRAEAIGDVEYRELRGLLRHPSWKGLRADLSDVAQVELPSSATA